MDSVIKSALAGRHSLLQTRLQMKPDLPLKFWRQQAHFTTPATGRPERAITGLEPVKRMLERHHVSLEEVSDRSGADLTCLQKLITELPSSPLVMVDAEDAVAENAESMLLARDTAVNCFLKANWQHSLRFFRPAGLGLNSCVEDITSVIGALVEPSSKTLLLDGIIWPKVEDAREMQWLCDLLAALEQHLGLLPNSIWLQVLVESAAALEQLDKIVAVCRSRLCGIIWGAADYAADVGLADWRNDHPLFDWARAVIVNSAGAAGVPAIDAMTFNYPVPVYRGDPLDDAQREANREKILTALTDVYADAIHGRNLGMSGKWVGHPGQLLMVQAAYREQAGGTDLQQALDALDSYRASVDQGRGATIIGEGAAAQMADRATDRHLRSRLRRAAAIGVLSADVACEVGLVNQTERDELNAMMKML